MTPQEAFKQAMVGKTVSQEPEGLAIEMSQQSDFKHVQIMEEKHFTASIDVWAPLICNTQDEADYLSGLALILGYRTNNKIFVRCKESGIGQHYPQGTEATYVRIPHL